MKFKTIALGAIMALLATPTLAEQKTSWTGFYVGAVGGLDMPTTDVSFDPGGIFGPYHADRLSGQGMGYGVTLGADYQLAGTQIVIGIGGDYAWSDADMSFAMPLNTTGKASIEKSWAVFGRLGFDMGSAMPYVLAGYTRADAKASGTFLGVSGSGSETLEGWLVGGGVEIALTQNVSLSGEYRYTKFDDVSLLGGDLTIEPERHEVRAVLKLKTGGLF